MTKAKAKEEPKEEAAEPQEEAQDERYVPPIVLDGSVAIPILNQKVARVRIYGYGVPGMAHYEIRWEAVNSEGIALFDSGSVREGYTMEDEDLIYDDIEAKYGPKVKVVDEIFPTAG